MEMSASVFVFCFLALETCACGLRLPRQFVAQGFNDQSEGNSRLEDVLDLTRPALHTLLKGLAALLVQLYPDIVPKAPTVPPTPPPDNNQKKEEPIKIFRQIMQLPAIYPPAPAMYPCQQPCCHHNMQPQHPPQDPCQSFQQPPEDPSHCMQVPPQDQMPQAPQTTQITSENCYPASACCHQLF